MSTPPLGNLIRLSPWHTDELPAHPDIKDSNNRAAGDRPQLLAFLRAILQEGVQVSQSFHTPAFSKNSSKAAPPSKSPVDILIRQISSSQTSQISWSGENVTIPRKKPQGNENLDEYWVARRSYHEDAKVAGSAQWSEFEFGLRDDHSKHEQEFTPNLFDAYKVLDWDAETKNIESEIQGFDTVRMSIHEMCHAVQFPLKPRCFPILVVTANVQPDDGFIAITVPLALSMQTTPTSFYSSGRNVTEGSDKQHRAKPVLGIYTAVERIRKITTDDTADGSTPGASYRKGKEGQTEWIMAFASDAKGNVPMFAQKLSVPGMVAKDVSYFLSWIRKVNPV